MGTIGRYISVIASWMLTLTSFLEVLCKIVALPDPIAKTLFGIFLMVSLLLSVHFFVYLMKMDAPNVKIPNKVNDYLNCIEKVERRNKSLHVISEKFDVNLIKAGNDVANQVAVRQRIQWTIRLANVDVATVGAFYMPITLGAYTAWQEKTLDIEVVLKKGDNSRILKPTQECFPDEDAASASVNMRTLQIIFPKGMEMHQSEQVYLYVTMTWLIDYQIKDVDIYFTDPENYGSYVQAVEVELCPTDNILKGWRLDVYEIDKNKRNMKRRKRVKIWSDPVIWTTSHNEGKMYLLQLTKERR